MTIETQDVAPVATALSPFLTTTPPEGRSDTLPDAYTDGRMIWVRSGLLAARSEMLGANAAPIFLTGDRGTDDGVKAVVASAEAVEVIEDDGEEEDDDGKDDPMI